MLLHGVLRKESTQLGLLTSLRDTAKLHQWSTRTHWRRYSNKAKAVRSTGPPLQKALPSSPSSNVYPTRLLIYHAGGPAITFVAVSKLTAIFVFLGATAYFGPVFLLNPSETGWAVVGVCVASALPLLVMVYSIPPMVTYIHMELPGLARVSRDRLIRFTQHLPESTKLDVTSLRWVWPRITRLRVSELQIIESKGHQARIGRLVPKEVLEARKWWMWRPETRFQVYKKTVTTPAPGIWELLLGHLKNRQLKAVDNSSEANPVGRPRKVLEGLKRRS